MNEEKVPDFKNLKLRQAVAMAINRDEFANKVIGDGSFGISTITLQKTLAVIQRLAKTSLRKLLRNLRPFRHTILKS